MKKKFVISQIICITRFFATHTDFELDSSNIRHVQSEIHGGYRRPFINKKINKQSRQASSSSDLQNMVLSHEDNSPDPGLLDFELKISDLGSEVFYRGKSETEFVYYWPNKMPISLLDISKDILPYLRDLESKFTEIRRKDPLSLVRICQEVGYRYLELGFDKNGPRLKIKLDDGNSGSKYLTKDNLDVYGYVCTNMATQLKRILGSDVESTDKYVGAPKMLWNSHSGVRYYGHKDPCLI